MGTALVTRAFGLLVGPVFVMLAGLVGRLFGALAPDAAGAAR